MLPKPEKKSKKIKSEQLDLVEEISEKDHIRKKQLYLFVSLSLTIGLSLIFYTYRHFRLPKISIPKPVVITNSINLDLDENSGIYIKSGDYTYSQNYSQNINEEIKYLDKLEPVINSTLYEKIPKGVTIRQFEEKTKTGFKGLYRLSIPEHDIYIILKYEGSNSDKFISTIPNEVEKIYWHLVEK